MQVVSPSARLYPLPPRDQVIFHPSCVRACVREITVKTCTPQPLLQCIILARERSSVRPSVRRRLLYVHVCCRLYACLARGSHAQSALAAGTSKTTTTTTTPGYLRRRTFIHIYYTRYLRINFFLRPRFFHPSPPAPQTFVHAAHVIIYYIPFLLVFRLLLFFFPPSERFLFFFSFIFIRFHSV